MPETSRIVSLCAVVAVQLLTGASVLWVGRRRRLLQLLPFLVSVAAGLLLATGVLDLLPEAAAALGTGRALWTVLLLTMAALFLLERLTGLSGGPEPGGSTVELAGRIPRAPHDDRVDPSHTEAVEKTDAHLHVHGHPTRPLSLLLGSATHSAVDGTALAAAFAVSPRVGWITAVAIALHEAPHRLGDFGLLLHLGVPRRRAAMLSVGAGCCALLGWAAVALLSGHRLRESWLLPVSAGSFLYIALADLLPELREEGRPREVLLQVLGFCSGIALTLLLLQLPGA